MLGVSAFYPPANPTSIVIPVISTVEPSFLIKLLTLRQGFADSEADYLVSHVANPTKLAIVELAALLLCPNGNTGPDYQRLTNTIMSLPLDPEDFSRALNDPQASSERLHVVLTLLYLLSRDGSFITLDSFQHYTTFIISHTSTLDQVGLPFLLVVYVDLLNYATENSPLRRQSKALVCTLLVHPLTKEKDFPLHVAAKLCDLLLVKFPALLETSSTLPNSESFQIIMYHADILLPFFCQAVQSLNEYIPSLSLFFRTWLASEAVNQLEICHSVAVTTWSKIMQWPACLIASLGLPVEFIGLF